VSYLDVEAVEQAPVAGGGLGKPTKGVSLGQDAWRRLRRNRMAMASLATLVVIGLLAFFTPLLPLAPPDKHQTDLQYQPPQFMPLFRETFDLDWQAIQATPKQMTEVRGELADAQQELNEAKRVADSPTDEEVQSAERLVRRKTNELDSILRRPYRDSGFPDIGPVSRWMARARYRLFGQWSLGPIAGRDEFGRDVLSRVFWGARISIIVGIVATLVSLTIGVTYGALAGYIGGWVDDVMMRFVDILYSIPFIFVVIFIITILDGFKPQLQELGIGRITIF
jgi:oligopeptide transport system permease protein